ncbi:gp58-like family protein [Lactobacillus delbrueckii]|uniref:gp58-like family protein n=1 Tax=Lactobacillus delbrueckii TaxID=1584 RepID=UPI001E35FC78|nr:gp58-like family protein [Lactobacillus delbrueckii]MCD5439844.1 hypothetical protein [Lactobacillus delbrueckii subsp. lactis]
MKSKSVSVNVTANGLAASTAQKAADQVAEKIKNESSARTAYQIANDETISELNQAQSDFESNLAWTKSQIEINSHQNDSAVSSLKSDMESSWDSISSTEQSLYDSASTASSEVDQRLESLKTQSSQSVAELRSTADSLYADANSMRNSLTAETSQLGSNLANVRDSLVANDKDIQNDLAKTNADIARTKNDLASQAASLAMASSELGSGMDQAYASLHAADDSLRTATSEIEQQTGQISGSLSTADSMIMFNSNAIAEVKRTANLIEADLTDTKGNVASVQAKADSLQSQVTDNKNNISSVKETANGLEQTVKHGSRNLIKTAMELSLENGDERVGDHVVGLVNSSHEDDTQAPLSVLPPELNGQKLTVSFDVLASDTSQLGKMFVNVGLFDIQGNKKAELTNVPFADIIANQWTRFSTTFDIPQDWTSAVIVDHTSKEIDGHTGEQITATLGEFYYSIQFKNASSVPYKIKCAQAEFGPNATAFIAPDSSISKLIQTSQELASSLADSNGNISKLQQTTKQISALVTDNAGNISQLQQTADGLGAQIANTNGDVSTLKLTANSLQSSITDNKNNISSVKQTAEQLSSTLSNQAGDLSQLKQTADSLQSQISNANGDISNVKQTADSLQSQVTDNKNNISSVKQTATNLTSQIQDANGNISQLKQTANGLSQTVKGGSRNLIKTAMELSLENSDEKAGDYVVGLVNPGNGGWHEDDTQAPLSILPPFLDGQKITVGFDVLVNDTSQLGGMYVNIGLFNGQGERLLELTNVSFEKKGITAGTWTRISNTFEIPEDWISVVITGHDGNAITDHTGNQIEATMGSFFYGVQFKNTSSAPYKIKCAQAEIGPNATAFIAPDFSISQLIQTSKELSSKIADNDGNISQLRQTATSLQMQVADNRGNISQVQQKADGLETQITNANDDISTFKQTASGLQSKVQDAQENISNIQQTAKQLNSDMKDAKENISSLQQTAGSFGTRITNAEDDVSSLQQTAGKLQTQITDNKNHASTIEETAKGISARVSGIENNKVVGSLLKLTDTEAGLGSYVNGKLIAGINTNTDGGVTIDGKLIHISGYTQIDNGAINAEKITVYNTIGDNKGNQYLSAAWGQLNSTIGSKDDQGNTLWGSINQTSSKLNSYYQELKNDGSSTRSLIQQKADQILLGVDQKVQYKTYTVSASSPWDFNYTKSIYENWFINGDPSGNYFYNGPDGLKPWVYVQSRGSADGKRFTVTVWKDDDPTQYQRVWNGSSWSNWVMLPNSSNLVSAINLSPDGVRINGKNIELNGQTKIRGQLNLLPTDQREVDQSVQGFHNAWHWRDSNVFAGTGGLQLQSTIISQQYSNDNTSISGLRGGSSAAITTLAPTYLKFTLYPSWNDVINNFSNQLTRTYIDAGRIETNDVWAGNFRLSGNKMRALDNKPLYVTNSKGTNFDGNGSVTFQVWGGIALGKQTIGSPTRDIYFRQGDVHEILKQDYSKAAKVTLHAQSLISQVANTVSSRLSVKTAITKVTYDRALMAVQNTDMYDYRYTTDDTGQHYVSGIIDDIHDKPEYNMDPMLINKERTARIDANLLGYHQVVLQEILKRLDKLEAK